jgi:hypothetical protein
MRLASKVRLAAVALLCAAGTGCDMIMATADESSRRMVGIVSWDGVTAAPDGAGTVAGPALSAPDTVQAGTPFQVTISTYGLHGCWREDGAVVTGVPGTLTLTPFDVVRTTLGGEERSCTGAVVRLPRTVFLVAGQRGDVTLRVQGRSVVGNNVAAAEPVTLEHPVHVR